MIDTKKPSVIIQRLKQPVKTQSQQQFGQPVRQLKISDRPMPTQNDLASSAAQFNKTVLRSSITPTLKMSKERPLLPKSSQMSTVTGSLLYQIQGQTNETLNLSPTQDFEFIITPTMLVQNTMRVSSPPETERIESTDTIKVGHNSKVPDIFCDPRFHNLSPKEQISRVRGTFQRENISNEEKNKMLEQKRIMKEVLDLQIEENKKKQLQVKELERGRAKQEEDRIQKEIDAEIKQQNYQKLIRSDANQTPQANREISLSSQPIQAINQLKRSISKDSLRSVGQLNHRDENIDNSREHVVQQKMKQTFSKVLANQQEQQPDQIKDYVQSGQGFYLQSEYIQFLKQQNDDLKAENNKKDQLIQGLIGTKPKMMLTRSSIGNINQFHSIIKKADSTPTQTPINPSTPSLINSLGGNQLTKSQSSKQMKVVPKSQQEKKIHYQRLPQIKTPQPQLSHLKVYNHINEDNLMDQFLATNENQEKETFLSRTKQLLGREEESNWSFGKPTQILPSVQQQKDPSTFSRKRNHASIVQNDSPQINKHQNEIQSKFTSMDYQQKITPLESFTPTHAIKKHVILPKPPQLVMQYQPGELPGQSTFMKSENNHVNPEFTFSNSISEMDHNYSNFGSSKKAKDKLPKEFQIVPQKRKFFI